MLRDNKEFRERFQRWKEGELVYENGRPIPQYQDGKNAEFDLNGNFVEKSDNTSVQRLEPVYPIKRNFIVEAQRKHAAEAVGPDTRSSYQRKQSLAAKLYANRQYLKAKDDAKCAEGLELMMKIISPSTYVEAATGLDLGTAGRFITDVAAFGLPGIIKSAGKSIGRQILKNQIKSEFRQGVERANIINDIFKNSPTLYDSGGNLLDYNDYLNDLFPKSKVKDILWHGSKDSNLLSFDVSEIGSHAPIKGTVGMYLSPIKSVASNYGSGGVYPVLLNTENPYITNLFLALSKNGVNVAKITPKVKSTILPNNDAVIAPFRSEIAFFNPEDALILGSYRDRNQFANFMQKSNRYYPTQGGVQKELYLTPDNASTLTRAQAVYLQKQNSFIDWFRSILPKSKQKLANDAEEMFRHVRGATAEDILKSFESRIPYAKNITNPIFRATEITKDSHSKLVDSLVGKLKNEHPSATEEELRNLFFEKHGCFPEDLFDAKGFVIRDDVTGAVEAARYKGDTPLQKALTKTHEENHTMYDFDPLRFKHKTVTSLKSPYGYTKNYLNEEAGFELPNLKSSNSLLEDAEYLNADEISSYMSEYKSLLGKTKNQPLTELDIDWLKNNYGTVAGKLGHYNLYKYIATHITNSKKFAKWCTNFSAAMIPPIIYKQITE